VKQSSADRVTRPPVSESDALARLVTGARMDQKTFHALYLKTPEKFKAELIGGVVHVASPVNSRHGFPHAKLIHWLSAYADETEGLRVAAGTTNILGDESEPQPDAFLMIDRKLGGAARANREGYIEGPPELVAEVSHTTLALDLNAKRTDYERAGVKEYVVVDVPERAIHWFVRRRGTFAELPSGDDGVFRSPTFPGLCLSAAAFFQTSPRPLIDLLKTGLATPEHAAFVAKLAARKKTPKRKKK
jgi:Uma2 family endonuclease